MNRAPELLFVDPAISDLATLLRGVRPGVEAIVLDPALPAARQVAAALTERQGLGAVHIVAHGAPGQVNFAGDVWSDATLADQAADFAAIGRALGEDGGLRLWSCFAGAGTKGEALVAQLAAATGRDVAAASGLVGASALGGRWELDAGEMIVPPLSAAGVAAYAGVMAATTWTGGVSSSTPGTGNWSAAGDWTSNGTSGVPGTNASAVLSGTTTYTVTVSANTAALTSLTIADANATLAISGASVTVSAATIANAGTIDNVGAGGTLKGTTISNDGGINVTAGTLTISGTLDNNSDGTVSVASGGVLSATGAIANYGTISVGGTLTDTSGFTGNTNNGSVVFAGGTVNIVGASTVFANSGSLAFSGGTLDVGTGGFVNDLGATITVTSVLPH